MRYILLLRSINVGGKNKVVMAEYRQHLENLNFDNVKSYINSGNLFFDSEDDLKNIHLKINEMNAEHYKFKLPIVILNKTQFNSEYDNLPTWWHEPMARKDVLFYTNQVEKDDVINFVENLTLQNEVVHISESAVHWGQYDEVDFLKTAYQKYFLKAPFYKQITIRNGKTFEKIHQLLND